MLYKTTAERLILYSGYTFCYLTRLICFTSATFIKVAVVWNRFLMDDEADKMIIGMQLIPPAKHYIYFMCQDLFQDSE